MLYKSKLLTLETMVYSWDYLDEHWYLGPSCHLYSYWIILDCLGHVCIWVELPVQRRLCPIFMRDVGSPDIHECFRGLTGSQRTPGFWGVTVWYQSLGIRIPRELGFGYPSPLGMVRC